MTAADNFPAYIAPILVLEGGGTYTDNPLDPQGPTIWGITAFTAGAAGYQGPLDAMTEAQAVAIYRTLYWEAPGFDLIDPIFPDLAAYMLGIGINQGPQSPSRMLQRVLNVFSDNGSHYPVLEVDGDCGPVTRSVLVSYIANRPTNQNGCAVLLGTLRGLVTAYYISIVEETPDQAVFAYGWLRDRALGLPESATTRISRTAAT